MRRASVLVTSWVLIGCGGATLRTRPAIARDEPVEATPQTARTTPYDDPEQTDSEDEDDGLADRAIAEAVRLELRADPLLPPDAIAVEVTGGVVELRGEVPHLSMLDAAIERAEMVRGTRAVMSLVQVARSGREDEQILADVQTALLVHPSTSTVREVMPRAVDGVVTLVGTVPSYASKRAADRVARSVRGVREVVNLLQLQNTVARSDERIEADVLSSLRADLWVDEWLLEVDVSEGLVSLSGTQPSSAAKRRAIEGAWVTGVRNVDATGLRVSPIAAAELSRRPVGYEVPNDQATQAWVTDALRRDPRLAHRSLEVEMNDGVAHLLGDVDSIEARRAAEETALGVLGVNRVDNRLRIDRDRWQSSRRLRRFVRDALRVNAAVADADVQVEVEGGTVTVRGRVASPATRAAVHQAIEQMAGVTEIRDELAAPELTASARPDDVALQQDIVTRLSYSPYVDASTIRVQVAGGEATLMGTVQDFRGEHAAIRAAYSAGATNVVDGIEIAEASEIGAPAMAAH